MRRECWRLYEVPKIKAKEQDNIPVVPNSAEKEDNDTPTLPTTTEEEQGDEDAFQILLDTAARDEDDEFEERYMSQMTDKYYPNFLLGFLLFGPIQPDGSDEAYQCTSFFCSRSELDKLLKKPSKKKKIDGRASICIDHAATRENDRTGADVMEKRGLSQRDMFLAANVATVKLRTLETKLAKDRDRRFHYLTSELKAARETEKMYLSLVPQAEWDGDTKDPQYLSSHSRLNN